MTEQSTRPTAELAQRYYDEGLVAFRSGDNEGCRRLSELAIATARAAGAPRERALGHIGLCRADFRDGDFDSGRENARLADEFARQVEADDVVMVALHMRAEMTRAQGDYAAALPLYEQLIEIDTANDDKRSLAMEHYNIGSVLIQLGELPQAHGHLDEALALCDAGERKHFVYVLLGYAGLLVRNGHPEIGVRLLGAVRAHLDEKGEVLDPAEAVEFDSHVAEGRLHAGAAFDSAYEEGRALSLDEARALIP